MVNFEGPHTLIGGFADVEITEVRPNSLRGKFLRGENEMNLRIATAPSEILARRPDNIPDQLGVAAFTPNPSEILVKSDRPDNVPDPLGVAAFTPH